MQPKTEEFLNLLLWSADKLAKPTFRNLTDSYESWAYRNGLVTQISKLENHKFLERDLTRPQDRLYRLSVKGRLHCLGGRDPQVCWSRKWDGRWRLVLFDIPTEQNTYRDRLRRYLRNKGFGYIQNSVWITPDPLEEERKLLAGGDIQVESLLLLEAQPCAGESNSEIVLGAWDFNRINQRYAQYMKLLDELPVGTLASETAAKALLRWAAAEREAWLTAVRNDPLLPERILPANYLGRKAWLQRIKVLSEAGRQLRSFNIASNPSNLLSHMRQKVGGHPGDGHKS